MTDPNWVEIVALVITLPAAALSVWSALHTRHTDKANLELQQRLVALEIARERTQIRDQRRASVRAALVDDPFGNGGTYLLLRNEGPAEAQDVRFQLDGHPSDQSELVLDSEIEIPVLGVGAEAPIQLYMRDLSDPVISILVEIEWRDGSGEPGSYRTTLIAP